MSAESGNKNKRAIQFERGRKADVRAAQMNSEEANQRTVETQKQLIQALIRQFNTEKRVKALEEKLQRLDKVVQINDWQLSALSRLLKRFVPELTAELLDKTIAEIQVEDFVTYSDQMDANQKLVDAADEVPQDYYHVIFTSRTFDTDWNELKDERLVRARAELGKEELLEPMELALRAMKVGETYSLNLEHDGKELIAEVTLLGLRKPVPQPAQPAADGASTESNG